MRLMHHRAVVLAAALFLALVVPARHAVAAACGEPGDPAAVAGVRASIAQNCDCAGAENHGAYVSCATGVVSDAIAGGNLRAECRGNVVRCAARSTCGRPGFVTCCRTTAKGKTKCSTKSSAAACRAPKGGSACATENGSCCDACGEGSCPDNAGFVTAATPPPCSRPTCREEIEATCGPPGGKDRAQCAKNVIEACESGQISCEGPTTTTTQPPATTTTTAVATTTTTQAPGTTTTTQAPGTTTTTQAPGTTTTSAAPTTTTTTEGLIQCCVPTSVGGAFDNCILVTATSCAGQSGINAGAGTCDPNPCPPGATTSTTAAPTTTTTEAPTTTTTTLATTTTTQAATTTTTAAATTTTTIATTTTTAAPTTTTIATTTTTAAPTTTTIATTTTTAAPTTTTIVTTTTTTTTTIVTTTTTTVVTTTTTTLACCSAARIETTSSAGTLEVSTIPAFPFPANVQTVIEAGAADATCKHNGIVPPGGFSVPTFCIPALGFSSDVMPTGCESGGADGAAMVWDAAAPTPDPDVNSIGDTSDPDGNNCATLGTGCVTAAGGAGSDTRGNTNTTRGGAPHATGSVHTQVDIPVHSITWVDGDPGDCPDLDGVYDPGTDTLITEFDFILSPTTGHTSATFTDLNADACAKAGNGPNSKSGDGIPATGPCCVVGQSTTVAATATAFTGGAPLYDITFKSVTPTTISSCGAPSSAATCVVSTDACKQ
ncbi:MAG TPA: hypothetical protein VKA21_02210 [Candidatus Binatia bacterium]|nr:hypothetical protein [Candidatus Binatia bacterium]